MVKRKKTNKQKSEEDKILSVLKSMSEESGEDVGSEATEKIEHSSLVMAHIVSFIADSIINDPDFANHMRHASVGADFAKRVGSVEKGTQNEVFTEVMISLKHFGELAEKYHGKIQA